MVDTVKTIIRSKLFIISLLILLSIITYINTFSNKLFYDDEELIYKNIYVQNLKFLPKYFTENMIAGAGKISNMYRPLLLVSFAVDHLIWKNNPFGYHLTNVLLHSTNSILVFLLIEKLFKKRQISILTSIFFAVHPVQTEAVTYVSGRTDLLYSIFTLSSIIISLIFISSKSNQFLLYFFSIILLIFSLLSKEVAIITPFLLIISIYILYKKNKNKKKLLFKSLPILLVDFLIIFTYIILRLTILNFKNSLNFYSTQNIYSQNLTVRIFTFSKVFFEYVKVLIFPKDLIFSRQIEYITSPLNLWVLLFSFLMIPNIL